MTETFRILCLECRKADRMHAKASFCEDCSANFFNTLLNVDKAPSRRLSATGSINASEQGINVLNGKITTNTEASDYDRKTQG